MLNIELLRRTYSDVVDPDKVAVIDGDGVAAPDVLGVDIGDGDVSWQCECEIY